MAIRIENTAVVNATMHPDELDRYAHANLLLYRTSLALMRNLADNGVFSEEEYGKIRTILNKKYDLPSGSIFAEAA